MLNGSIIDQITSDIIANRTFSKSIISICGAADIGKSYISKKIVTSLSKMNITTSHLTMDSFMIDRQSRNKNNISGYCIEAYNMREVIKSLKNFKRGKSFEYKPYLHSEGRNANYFIEIKNSEILIFDGLHTMFSTLMPYIDDTYFIYTTDIKLKAIRHEADITKRCYSMEFSKRISEKELSLYKKNVEPYMDKSRCHIFLESKWNYKIKN